MKNKPALAAALALSGGIFAAKYFFLQNLLWICCIIFLLLSIIEFIFYRKIHGREIFPSIAVLLLLFCASGLHFIVDTNHHQSSHISQYLDTDSVTLYCKVVDEPRVMNGKTKMLVSILSLHNEMDSIAVEGNAYLSVYADKRTKEHQKEIIYGSFLNFKSVLQSPPDSRNPGEFNYKEYLSLNNIFALVSVFGYSNVTIVGEREPQWFYENLIFPAKNFIQRTITTVMNGDEANFLIGLLLGDRTELSEEIKNAFTNTGTIHVLAVSGSHVILVVAIMYVVFGLIRVPHRGKIIATIFAIIFYTYLTGATPSVVRSSIMSVIVLLGKYFEKKTVGYNVLGLSAVIILLFDPKQLFDVGFQLSFSAVFSLIYFYPKLTAMIKNIPERFEEFKIISWLLKALAVSVAAQLGTIPFTAYYFGKVSIVSFAANLIVVPLVELIVTIGLAGVLLGTFSMWIASCFSEVNNLLAWFTLTFVKLAEQVPYAVVNTATFGWKETLLYSAIVAWLFNLHNATLQKRIGFVVLLVFNSIIYSSIFESDQKKMRVTFLDVGQGDASVIQFPTGETIIVDGGPKSLTYDAGEKIVAPFLKKCGITTIDAIITTHPHADHLGGVPFLLKNFNVHSTIDPHQRAQSKLFYEYDVLEQKVTMIDATAGMNLFSIPNVRLYALHPTKQFLDTDSSNGYSDLNESSVVFKLQYGKTSIVFTGDAEIPAEEQIIQTYGDFIKSDVLKAGHHGSITSSSENFIDVIQPKDVVITVGKFNKFRHPSKIVLNRFSTRGVVIHRTDQKGAIVFDSDGNSFKNIAWRKN